jgi:hypothetical protein
MANCNRCQHYKIAETDRKGRPVSWYCDYPIPEWLARRIKNYIPRRALFLMRIDHARYGSCSLWSQRLDKEVYGK